MNLPVDGAGLGALSGITAKAEVTRDEILKEIAALLTLSMSRNCLISRESRQFVDVLYELEHAITNATEEVGINKGLFQEHHAKRKSATYKQVCKAIWGVSTSSLSNDRRLRP